MTKQTLPAEQKYKLTEYSSTPQKFLQQQFSTLLTLKLLQTSCQYHYLTIKIVTNSVQKLCTRLTKATQCM